MPATRPDPDQLLETLRRDEEAAARGRLKIFFGACAGVGKTWAMLAAAQASVEEGVDVLVGVVETHGRAETGAQLAGLRQLPPSTVEYRGRQLAEFDLDAALAARPGLLLVDEYAHANVPGSRHAKRWQDIEELLAAGIDVYTTLNVQHLESLNDIVGQITGIVVRETVPDRVFDAAAEVTLVDLPPDELLTRLQDGKVYLGPQAERAAQHFFRKGNLLALRELALRRVADRVDAQMRAYRADQAIAPVWQARERLLVCVGSGEGSDRLLRSAARLAASLHADWLAVHVETAGRASPQQLEQVRRALALAQELGAETAMLAGSNVVATLLAYAHSRNVSKLVVGKTRRRAWWQPAALSERLAEQTRDGDVYVVATTTDEEPEDDGRLRYYADAEATTRNRRGVAAAVLACVATTGLAAALSQVFDLANVVMLYLLAVVFVAIRYGRLPGAVASVLAVACFDFFLVPPTLSLTVSDTQYLLTFAVMLVVALVIGQLAARLRFEAQAATQRERRTRALFELTRELGAALTTEQIVEIATRNLEAVFAARAGLLLPDSDERVRAAGSTLPVDAGVAQWVYQRGEPAGRGTRTLPASDALYLPLKAPMRTRGVLALAADAPVLAQPEQRRLLDTFAAQIALAIERVHYVEVAQDAIVAMEGERLRNSVLASVSHDLRTPLTSLTGLASLLVERELPPERQREIASSIRDESERLGRLVTNLLEMARLEAGVRLSLEWQPVDEVIGAALRLSASVLARHAVVTDVPADLPILQFDAVLIERVLVNLLENAAKYAPPGSTVTVSARAQGAWLAVTVADDGPGLPAGTASRVFDKFARGEAESATPGVGLGLAICRAIVSAHGGRIEALNRAPHGAAFVFTLPVKPAPSLPE